MRLDLQRVFYNTVPDKVHVAPAISIEPGQGMVEFFQHTVPIAVVANIAIMAAIIVFTCFFITMVYYYVIPFFSPPHPNNDNGGKTKNQQQLMSNGRASCH